MEHSAFLSVGLWGPTCTGCRPMMPVPPICLLQDLPKQFSHNFPPLYWRKRYQHTDTLQNLQNLKKTCTSFNSTSNATYCLP